MGSAHPESPALFAVLAVAAAGVKFVEFIVAPFG
jgi:hypothetical protein